MLASPGGCWLLMVAAACKLLRAVVALAIASGQELKVQLSADGCSCLQAVAAAAAPPLGQRVATVGL